MEIVGSGACVEDTEDREESPKPPETHVRSTLQEKFHASSLLEPTNTMNSFDTSISLSPQPTSKEGKEVFEMLGLSTQRNASKHPPKFRGVASPSPRLDTNEVFRNRRPPPRPILHDVDNSVFQGESGGQ